MTSSFPCKNHENSKILLEPNTTSGLAHDNAPGWSLLAQLAWQLQVYRLRIVSHGFLLGDEGLVLQDATYRVAREGGNELLLHRVCGLPSVLGRLLVSVARSPLPLKSLGLCGLLFWCFPLSNRFPHYLLPLGNLCEESLNLYRVKLNLNATAAN